MKIALLLLCIITEVLSCSIKVCLRLIYETSTLTLICKTDDLHLPVLFGDNFGKEIAFCNVPKPYPLCHPNYQNITVSQNPEKNETVITVNGTIDNRVNGNWSCRHGMFIAFIEINIPKTIAPRNDNDEAPYWMKVLPVVITCTLVILFLSCIIIKLTVSIRRRHACPLTCCNTINVTSNGTTPGEDISLVSGDNTNGASNRKETACSSTCRDNTNETSSETSLKTAFSSTCRDNTSELSNETAPKEDVAMLSMDITNSASNMTAFDGGTPSENNVIETVF